MLPWHREDVRYFPILRFKLGELLALRHLPRQDKRRLFPLVPLSFAPNAKRFERTLEKLAEARGDSEMAIFADLAEDAGPLDARNPAHARLLELMSPAHHFANWRTFVEEHGFMIPVLRTPPGVAGEAIAEQVRTFEQLGRGMVLRLRRGRRDVVNIATAALAAATNLDNLLIVIDLGQLDGNFHIPMMEATALLRHLLGLAAGRRLHAVCSASSFPFTFDGDGEIITLPIWERQMVEELRRQPGLDAANLQLFYGDYGSARAEEREGWRGPPRVDYPTDRLWIYCRQKGAEKRDGVPLAAQEIMGHPAWENELRIWGAEKIREAAGDDLSDLGASWALPAVRINLHLHAQVHVGGRRESFLNTDEEWLD